MAAAPELQPRALAPGEVLAEAPLPEGSTASVVGAIPAPALPTVPLADYEELLAARDTLGLQVTELEGRVAHLEARRAALLGELERLGAENASLRARLPSPAPGGRWVAVGSLVFGGPRGRREVSPGEAFTATPEELQGLPEGSYTREG